jgi:hypothetical protein
MEGDEVAMRANSLLPFFRTLCATLDFFVNTFTWDTHTSIQTKTLQAAQLIILQLCIQRVCPQSPVHVLPECTPMPTSYHEL